MAAQLYKTTTGRMFHAGEIAILTVGLPARGKTYLAHKLSRYLRWLGVSTAIFSVGDYRRRMVGTNVSHDFFTSDDTLAVRNQVADRVLADLLQWFRDGGQVGIYDASNTEESRRAHLYRRLLEQHIQVLFIEAICDKEEIIQANILELKASSPDYRGMDLHEIQHDFRKRIDGYMPNYATIQDPALPYIKVINVGEQIIANQVKGYLQTRIVYYLMNLHIAPRKIYLSRNGESTNESFFRSDAPLSPKGESYARRLPACLSELRTQEQLSSPLRIWTSPRQRSVGSSLYFDERYDAGVFTIRQRSSLVEMNTGAVDGMPEEEIKKRFPEDYTRFCENSYVHRYPRAESYHDMALRLEDVLLELERERDDVLIIAHPTVLRCIYAYLLDLDAKEIPTLAIPEETLIELIPVAYGCKEKRTDLRFL